MVIFVVHPSDRTTASSRAIAIIPARYASTRLPGKPLLDIDGRTLIEHVYRRACQAPSLDSVIVATDDQRIRDAVERFGGVARMTDAGHATGSDRLAEVADGLSCDLIVNVQGDEPLIEPEMIEEVLAPFAQDPALQMSTLRRRIDDPADLANPNVVKVVTAANDDALYFSRAPIPYTRDPADDGRPPLGFKHIGIYAYRRPFLRRYTSLPPTPAGAAGATGAAPRPRARLPDQDPGNQVRLDRRGHPGGSRAGTRARAFRGRGSSRHRRPMIR